MGLFNLFKKKEANLPPINLGDLITDVHSHLLPGIDDGSKNMDETIAMLAKFESLGFKKVITTPHIMSDYYKNTPEIILEKLNEVKSVAKQLNLTIEIEAAAEYYNDEYFIQLIKEKNLLTFGDNYVLVEFAFMSEPTNIQSMFFELLSSGYNPVLAHFERYAYWWGSTQIAEELRAKGVKIQMNLNSLSGHYGPEVKKQAKTLIDKGLVDFVGTDCHRMDHLMLLEKNLTKKYYHKFLELNLLNRSL